MTEQEFHSFYGHIGSGKHCALCAIIRGPVRFIYSVVDKYVETRMGYFWDLDTLTVSVQSNCGGKYYSILRDRGSKVVKEFPLVFRDDFVDQFELWLEERRADRVYDVYEWDFCTVIRADNDGVRMRKSKRWLALMEKFHFRMWYASTERKETNSHQGSGLRSRLRSAGKRCRFF